MWRTLSLTSFLFFFCITISFTKSNPNILVSDEDPNPISTYMCCITGLIDHNHHLKIEDILALDSTAFSTNEELSNNPTYPLVVWKKIKITNTRDVSYSSSLSFSRFVDSLQIYDVVEGRIVDYRYSGRDYQPSEKEFPSVYNTLPIFIPAGNTKYFYVRQYFKKESHIKDVLYGSIGSDKKIAQQLFHQYSGQVFYAGLMLMFALLSFFTSILFRDRGFFYFGFMQVSFVLYFITINNIFQIFISNTYSLFGIGLLENTVVLIILAVSMFITNYTKFRHKNRRYYYFYISIVILTIANIYITPYIGIVIKQVHNINNGFLIVWILVNMLPLFYYARKGDRSSRNLLVAIMLLFFSSIIYVLSLLNVLPINTFTKYSFQGATVIFSLLIFYHLFEMVRTINFQKQEANTLNLIKSKFFTNISHEFRTPLTLIIGPLKQLIDKSNDEKDIKLMEGALKNSDRLLNMVNQLLDLSRIEGGKLGLELAEYEYVSFLKGVLMSFESLAETKQMKIEFETNAEQLNLWYDMEKMEIIIFNLLSNAFKYTPQNGKVSLKIKEEEELIKVTISDTGVGIAKNQLPYVFDRFFRVESSGGGTTDGSGIGLSLSKELVDLHKGNITVSSKKGSGSTFSLEFKKGNSHFDSKLIVDHKIQDDNILTQINSVANVKLLTEEFVGTEFVQQSPSTSLGTRPNILLVEDNSDVRQYLKNILIDQFQILEARNGQEGLELAIEHMPELVISDVMMPIMDGMEFCSRIKKDVRTSHIPVIMLTAKVGNKSKLEGLELGADDYLTKPFHAKELNIRVRKLIELRVQLRKKLLESPTLSIKNPDGNPVENKFIEEVSTIINTHLDDHQFSVEVLADKIGISRVHLNRKIKSIADMSTNKYIQHIRLNKALILLEEEGTNVSEVTYKVGFNSVAYFVKSFKKQFGETPGTFQKKNQNQSNFIKH